MSQGQFAARKGQPACASTCTNNELLSLQCCLTVEDEGMAVDKAGISMEACYARAVEMLIQALLVMDLIHQRLCSL